MQLRNCFSVIPLVLFFLSNQVAARFTLKTCSSTDCVLNTAAGLCYVPDGTTVIVPCSGAGHADLATVFQTHLRQDLSIAYYNAVDNSRLGGIDFTVPSDGSIVRLCLSGQAAGGDLWTLCLDAMGDNTLSGSPVYCKLRQAPAHVSDGCYGRSSVAGNTTTITSSKGGAATSTSIQKNWAVAEKHSRKKFLLQSFLLLVFGMFICPFF
jgi:hypothetical protein